MASPSPTTAAPQAMLDELERLGAGMRKVVDDPATASTEIDLWLPPDAIDRVDAIVQEHGFHRFIARGHEGHRFYLGFYRHRWVKLDFKRQTPGNSRWSLPGSFKRRLPASWRRLGPVVAFVGPDGAGKGTVLEAVEKAIPVAVDVVILGRGSSRYQRKRARILESDPDARRTPIPRWRQMLEPFFVSRTLVRRAVQLARVYAAAWRGRIVLCDRHPLDALAIDPRRTWLARSLERFVVGRLLPWPDRVVLLDAPGEVMFARKGEHSPERLESWRQGYAAALASPDRRATVVPTDGDRDESINIASSVVWGALAERRRWTRSGQ